MLITVTTSVTIPGQPGLDKTVSKRTYEDGEVYLVFQGFNGQVSISEVDLLEALRALEVIN